MSRSTILAYRCVQWREQIFSLTPSFLQGWESHLRNWRSAFGSNRRCAPGDPSPQKDRHARVGDRAIMIHDLITAIIVTSAAVLASELLVRIWDYF
jgi:hypothetical protein